MKINEFFASLNNRPETAQFIDDLCQAMPQIKEVTVRRWVNLAHKAPDNAKKIIAEVVSERIGRDVSPEELFPID